MGIFNISHLQKHVFLSEPLFISYHIQNGKSTLPVHPQSKTVLANCCPWQPWEHSITFTLALILPTHQRHHYHNTTVDRQIRGIPACLFLGYCFHKDKRRVFIDIFFFVFDLCFYPKFIRWTPQKIAAHLLSDVNRLIVKL